MYLCDFDSEIIKNKIPLCVPKQHSIWGPVGPRLGPNGAHSGMLLVGSRCLKSTGDNAFFFIATAAQQLPGRQAGGWLLHSHIL